MAQLIYKGIAAEIRKQRVAIGMTQQTLADKVGLSRTAVTSIEQGGQAIFVHQLVDFASALRLRVRDLLPALIDKPTARDEFTIEFKTALDLLDQSQRPR